MKEPSRAPAPSFLTLPRLATPPPTILEYLIERFSHIAPEAWRERFKIGAVRFADGCTEGDTVTCETPYRPLARVCYFRAVAKEPTVPFVEEILYRDEHLLVADKPHFLPVPSENLVRLWFQVDTK